jgi:hypothetical protein
MDHRVALRMDVDGAALERENNRQRAVRQRLLYGGPIGGLQQMREVVAVTRDSRKVLAEACLADGERAAVRSPEYRAD